MLLYPSPPRCGLTIICTCFSQCALDQGDGGWAIMANNIRYGIQKVSSYLKGDPWLDPLAQESPTFGFHSTTFLHKATHIFVVVHDGGGWLSSRTLNKCFDSFHNGWSIDASFPLTYKPTK